MQYFTRSGTFEITNGTVRYLGYGGYHWNTGVAGSANATSGGVYHAPDSVCLKNWRLPDGGDTTSPENTQRNTYYYLLNQYGLTSALSNNIDDKEFAMPLTPLYYVRSGDVTVYKGADYLWAQGRTEYYSTNTRNNGVQHIMMFHSIVQPDYTHGTVETGSIRCLAR